MAPRLTPEARALLRIQRRLIACWQGALVGMTYRQLRGAPAGDPEWSWAGRRTLVVGDPHLDPARWRVVGCLDAGPRGMLAGISALQEYGWPHRGDGRVHVVVPRNEPRVSRRVLPSVRVHYGHASPDSSGVVPRTPLPRSTVDAAAWARSDREADFIVLSTLQSGLVSPSQVLSCLAERKVIKRAARVRALVQAFKAGSHSMGELDFLRECRRRCLPEPRLQVPRRDSYGQLRFVDAEFVRTDGRTVMVEIDGIGHMSAASWREDIARHNALALATDAMVLRATAWELKHDPEPFYRQLAAALRPRTR